MRRHYSKWPISCRKFIDTSRVNVIDNYLRLFPRLKYGISYVMDMFCSCLGNVFIKVGQFVADIIKWCRYRLYLKYLEDMKCSCRLYPYKNTIFQHTAFREVAFNGRTARVQRSTDATIRWRSCFIVSDMSHSHNYRFICKNNNSIIFGYSIGVV